MQSDCWYNLSAAGGIEGAASARTEVEKALAKRERYQAEQCARDRFAADRNDTAIGKHPASACVQILEEQARETSEDEAEPPLPLVETNEVLALLSLWSIQGQQN